MISGRVPARLTFRKVNAEIGDLDPGFTRWRDFAWNERKAEASNKRDQNTNTYGPSGPDLIAEAAHRE